MSYYEFKVISGEIDVGNDDFRIKNKNGGGRLQDVLNFYGKEGYDLQWVGMDQISEVAMCIMRREIPPEKMAAMKRKKMEETPDPDYIPPGGRRR